MNLWEHAVDFSGNAMKSCASAGGSRPALFGRNKVNSASSARRWSPKGTGCRASVGQGIFLIFNVDPISTILNIVHVEKTIQNSYNLSPCSTLVSWMVEAEWLWMNSTQQHDASSDSECHQSKESDLIFVHKTLSKSTCTGRCKGRVFLEALATNRSALAGGHLFCRKNAW